MKPKQNAIYCLALLACGCSVPATGAPSTAPPGAQVVIRGINNTYSSAIPAELKATFGSTPTFQLSIQGASATESWGVVAWLTADQVLQGTIGARVSAGPIGDGVASLSHRMAYGSTNTQFSGTLTASLAGSRIDGTVSSNPASASAAFTGKVVVSCWVSRSALATAPSGGGTVGAGADSEPLVEDTALASPQCAMLKKWRAN